MTRRSDDDGEPPAVDPRHDPEFQRAADAGAPRPEDPPVAAVAAVAAHGQAPAGRQAPPQPQLEPSPQPPGRAPGRVVVARWLAPVLWVLAVAFPAAGLGIRALAARIATSMEYSSFGAPLGDRWLLDLAPLLVALAPGIVAGGPVAVIAALAVHALRHR
ncbi:hypothetical protein [Clavibacter zhangzhiyongii]|uniref:hypothetical protein n=1 Tax=Clavibacter zhangzhiyongii TaxID=2768071 RepID=UPI001F444DD7|nr:hypothetical protein [Clavibacter zhangzhiyongii]